MNSASSSQTGQLDNEWCGYYFVVFATHFHLGGSGQPLVFMEEVRVWMILRR